MSSFDFANLVFIWQHVSDSQVKAKTKGQRTREQCVTRVALANFNMGHRSMHLRHCKYVHSRGGFAKGDGSVHILAKNAEMSGNLKKDVPFSPHVCPVMHVEVMTVRPKEGSSQKLQLPLRRPKSNWKCVMSGVATVSIYNRIMFMQTER